MVMDNIIVIFTELIRKGWDGGDYVVISYDWSGTKAQELMRTENALAAITRAQAAGAYSAVVFALDVGLPIYYNQAAQVRIGFNALNDWKDFLINGKFLDYPEHLKGIFELAKERGYTYDSWDSLNSNMNKITEWLNNFSGG